MSMSSLTGKRILSLIRDGDFAHPGETDAIDLVMEGLPRDRASRLLDLGCGLGGTAALIAERGYGHVSGVDVDPETIAYAQRTYPEQAFVCASATDVSNAVSGPFDAIVMFTAFYGFPDQERVLRECRTLAHAGTELRIFDYSMPTWNTQAQEFCARYARGDWKPLVLDEAAECFSRNGWRIGASRDLTSDFRRWYQELLAKIDRRRERIVQASDEHWCRYAYQRYQELLRAIEDGIVGGVVIHAMPADQSCSTGA
jgi:phosphoethanolamine N-methyltransferase